MAERDPIAFLSYVRSDDEHDGGKITTFRLRLEGEVRVQTGKPFAIFQDRNDITWGQQWDERIKKSLAGVTFLIPILTPSFFESPACRSEFETFLIRERTLGVNRLILPLYYVTCDQLDADFQKETDALADVLRERQWTDWRPFRFKAFNDGEVGVALAQMAGMIKASMKELETIKIAAAPVKLQETSFEATKGEAPSVEKEIKETEETAKSELLSQANLYEIHEIRTEDLSNSNAVKAAVEQAARQQNYYVYTRKFDETVYASDFAEPEELLRLYQYVTKYSNALQVLFESQIKGLIAPLRRYETDTVSLTLLLDNSGSMRGNKVVYLAAWSLLIIDILDSFGIKTEVLGYTTRTWKGGQCRELWLADGKPPKPGRLNDLRHVIYKTFADNPRAASSNFGILAREGLLKENIDGEALLWSASRLAKEPSANKILYVFTDGAPMDDSTLSVNSEAFLTDHLKSVVANIKLQSEITLKAIGIESDVSGEYGPSPLVRDATQIGIAFLESFVKVIEGTVSRRARVRRRRGTTGRPAQIIR